MIHQFLQRLEANRVLMKNKIILSIVTIIVVAIFAFIYWLKPEDNFSKDEDISLPVFVADSCATKDETFVLILIINPF